MKIAIVHNEVTNDSLPDEQDVIKQAEAVNKSLLNLGHDTVFIPFDLNLNKLKLSLIHRRPDIVFNLSESLGGYGRLLHVVPALLDALNIPYTGACSEAVYNTSHKVMAKERLRAYSLPTPDWINPFPKDMPWINSIIEEEQKFWIIKSLWEHASFGLDENCIVKGDNNKIISILKQRASQLGGACFAEQFIDGREFNISLLGNGREVMVMPPAEIIFQKDDNFNIVGYKAKWIEDTPEYKQTPRSFDFSDKDTALIEQLKKLSIKCWHIFNLRGYARVDFRVDKNNNPMILEINANPCISPDAGFAAALEQGGITYDEAIEKILNDTFR